MRSEVHQFCYLSKVSLVKCIKGWLCFKDGNFLYKSLLKPDIKVCLNQISLKFHGMSVFFIRHWNISVCNECPNSGNLNSKSPHLRNRNTKKEHQLDETIDSIARAFVPFICLFVSLLYSINQKHAYICSIPVKLGKYFWRSDVWILSARMSVLLRKRIMEVFWNQGEWMVV